jgi:GGDEF domain-containing protein
MPKSRPQSSSRRLAIWLPIRNHPTRKVRGFSKSRQAQRGLPNTRAFERSIGERLSQEQPFALLVGGVDALSSTTARGEIHADDVLRELASLLQHSLLPGDEVARVGDDAFAVLAHADSSEAAS